MNANKSFEVKTAEECNGTAKVDEILEKIKKVMDAKPKQSIFAFEFSDETYNQCNGRVVSAIINAYKYRGYIVTIKDRVITIVRPTIENVFICQQIVKNRVRTIVEPTETI